jgi:hypothetical protein
VKQAYDPEKVIAAVAEHLCQAGVQPDMSQEGYGYVTALTGAGMLLRGLGVFPAADPADAYKRILDDDSWEDADDRRAQEYVERPH